MRSLCAILLLAATACAAGPPTHAEREASFAPFAGVRVDGLSLRDHLAERTVGLIGRLVADPSSGEVHSGEPPLSVAAAAAIAPDGYLLTAAHAIEPAGSVVIVLGTFPPEGTRRARIVWRGDGSDPTTDLAILHVDVERPIPSFAWEDVAELRPGERVALAGLGTVAPGSGDPGGFAELGVVGGRLREEPTRAVPAKPGRPSAHRVFFDAPISRGDSGGPVVSARGRLAGITIGSIVGVFGPDLIGSAEHALRPDPAWIDARIALDRAERAAGRIAPR